MAENTTAKPKLKGHGSFILREGWINKGLRAVETDAKVFTAKDATDILGVGSNMVLAIRYWLQAFRLLEDKTTNGAVITDLGKLVLEKDSYLEDIFTVWLLHSQISKNWEKAPMIQEYFNDDMYSSVTRDSLLGSFVNKWKGFSLSEKSIADDVAVLLNMYCREKVKDDPEDKIVSPLNELGLITLKNHIYEKTQPDLRSLPDEIILYELSLMFEELGNDADVKTLSIDKVVDGENCIGRIYNLSRVSVNQKLDRIEALGYIRVDRTAGLDVIYDCGVPDPLAVLSEYYNNR